MVNPLVSIIVPVFNSEPFIKDAIRSLLQQKEKVFEIIIIDDGSTDNTPNIARSFQDDVRYYYQKNQGPAAARNYGIKEANGEILGFLDADDLWTETSLSLRLASLHQNPDLQIVMGHAQAKVLSDAKNIEPNFLKPHILPLFGCGLFRREVFQTVGLLDASLKFSEDQDWFLRAKEKQIPMKIIPEVTLLRQMHGANMTADINWKQADILKVLKKSIDRRRASGSDAKDLKKLSDYFGEQNA